MLLGHKPGINSQSGVGRTPLHEALEREDSSPGKVIDIVRLLLNHGADTNIPDCRHSTPLHKASSCGWPEIVRLLLSYGAKVNEKDGQGRTPFRVASSEGHNEVMKILLEYGAVPQP